MKRMGNAPWSLYCSSSDAKALRVLSLSLEPCQKVSRTSSKSQLLLVYWHPALAIYPWCNDHSRRPSAYYVHFYLHVQGDKLRIPRSTHILPPLRCCCPEGSDRRVEIRCNLGRRWPMMWKSWQCNSSQSINQLINYSNPSIHPPIQHHPPSSTHPPIHPPIHPSTHPSIHILAYSSFIHGWFSLLIWSYMHLVATGWPTSNPFSIFLPNIHPLPECFEPAGRLNWSPACDLPSTVMT